MLVVLPRLELLNVFNEKHQFIHVNNRTGKRAITNCVDAELKFVYYLPSLNHILILKYVHT